MNFKEIITEQKNRYPLSTPQDFGKLSYQSEFGPKHLGIDYEKALNYLEREWKADDLRKDPHYIEPIGNGYYRCHLWQHAKKQEIELFAKLFVLTAQNAGGTKEGLMSRLEQVKQQGIEGMADWITEYEKAGCPVLSHSERYRETYHPHYRLIHQKYVEWFPVLFRIADTLHNKERIILAIDGNCGGGKTTFANILKEIFGGRLIHIDDYYLPMKERAQDWRQTPAGNMDLTRFRREVLEPAKEGKDITYRPFLCQKQAYQKAEILKAGKLTIIEGSYSQHPDLTDFYDLTIFLSCDTETQKRRLKEREGDYYEMFENCWIPLENLYYERFQIKEKADIVVQIKE